MEAAMGEAKRRREAAASGRHYWELQLVDVIDLAHMFIDAHPERFGYLDLILSRIDQLHEVPGEAVCNACGQDFGGALPQGYGMPIVANDDAAAWCLPLCGDCAQRDDVLQRLTELRCRPLFNDLAVIGSDSGPDAGRRQ
jgi:hypothetical protein